MRRYQRVRSMIIIELITYLILGALIGLLVGGVDSMGLGLVGTLLSYAAYLLALHTIWRSAMGSLGKVMAVLITLGGVFIILIPGEIVRRLAFVFYSGSSSIPVALGEDLKKTADAQSGLPIGDPVPITRRAPTRDTGHARLVEGAIDGAVGIEVQGSQFVPLIAGRSRIPCKCSTAFSAASPSQTEISVHLLQAPGSTTVAYKTFGHFTVRDLPSPVAKERLIEISIHVDATGRISVTARDMNAKPLTVTHAIQEPEEAGGKGC
ncbi:MAG: Hsp70 family protein [Candidatus Eisenbacteria bacterium]|nr:Hsp70 family protein [Candidatus Eisenbacteria bacterium]